MTITWRDQPTRGRLVLDFYRCEPASAANGRSVAPVAARFRQLFVAIPPVDLTSAKVPRQP
jgi:hypothetical protein